MGMKQVLFGIGVGAVIGLLCAPKKGSELRDDLKETGKKAYEKTKNLSKQDLIDVLNASYNGIVKFVEDFDADAIKGSTKTKLSELKVSVDELAAKAKENENINELVGKISKMAENAANKINEYKASLKEGQEASEEVINGIIDDEKDEIDEIIDEIKEDTEE